jgi:hypothetical protein
MMKKILVLLILVFLLSNVLANTNAEIIKKYNKSEKNIDGNMNIRTICLNSCNCGPNKCCDAYAFPSNDDDEEWTTFGYEMYDIKWDSDRCMWHYTFRFDWYQISDLDNKYVYLSVTTDTSATGIVKNSLNEFGQGGWNVEELNHGDFEDFAEIVCSAVIGFIPVAGHFATGLELAQALRNHADAEPNDPETYTWEGEQLKEASGFYQVDYYVKPRTEYCVKFHLNVYTSRLEPGGGGDYDEYSIGYDIRGIGPDHATINPENIDFGSIDVGESSSEKLITIKNDAPVKVGFQSITTSNGVFKITQKPDNDYKLKPYETVNVLIKFNPVQDKEYVGKFWVSLIFGDGCGNEEDDNYINIFPSYSIELRGKGEDDCCFAAGTKITMWNGKTKNIEDIRIGDRVLSYDKNKERFSSWTVKLLGNPIHPVYSINNGLIETTCDHPFYIKKTNGEEGFGAINSERARNATSLKGKILTIEIGDKLYSKEGKWIEITDISEPSNPVQTYNLLSFSGKKTYFANGVLVYEEHPPNCIKTFIKELFNIF